MRKRKIYLAIPYSFNPELSYEIVNEVAARLMSQQDCIVFSPISHSHPISQLMSQELREDHDFWLEQDMSFLHWADEVHVIQIGENGSYLIELSRGVQRELHEARLFDKPIVYIQYHLHEQPINAAL